MTDYLEELTGGDALLEAARRLDGLRGVLERQEVAVRAEGLRVEPYAQMQAEWNTDAAARSPGGESAGLAEEVGEFPLLVQTVRLDRAAAYEAVQPWERRKNGGVLDVGSWEAGWQSAAAVRSATEPGRSAAEQVDRTFQRDSRRYDGRFFLY